MADPVIKELCESWWGCLEIRHPHWSTPKGFFFEPPQIFRTSNFETHCRVLYPMSLSFLMGQTGKCHQCFNLPWNPRRPKLQLCWSQEGSLFLCKPRSTCHVLKELFLMFVVCILTFTSYSRFWFGIVKSRNVIGNGMFCSNNIQRHDCFRKSELGATIQPEWYIISDIWLKLSKNTHTHT